MPEEFSAHDPRSLWLSQPGEAPSIDPRGFVDRRIGELHSRTRADILSSLAAAVFFVAVLVLRFDFPRNPIQAAALASVAAWVLLSLYWFRHRLGRRPAPDLAAPALQFYRSELLLRRRHLRNEWLWHGPVLLACVIFAVTFLGQNWPSPQRLRAVSPFAALLVLWIALGIRRRWLQSREIQRELDELARL